MLETANPQGILTPDCRHIEGLLPRDANFTNRHESDLNPLPGGLEQSSLSTMPSECPLQGFKIPRGNISWTKNVATILKTKKILVFTQKN